MKNPNIAKTILEQMSGISNLMRMTGAHAFIDQGDGVSFKFKTSRGKPNYLRVILCENDTYTMDWKRLSKVKFDYRVKDLFEDEGVYWDKLKSIFESRTGLYLTL